MRKIVQCNIIFLAVALGLGGCASLDDLAIRSEPLPLPLSNREWRPVDADTGQIADVAQLEMLSAAFPNSSSVQLRLLNAYAEQDDWTSVERIAGGLILHGYAFAPASWEYLLDRTTLGDRPDLLALHDLNAEPLGESEVVASLPEEAQLPEGLAMFDEGSFAVTTVVSGRLWLNRGEGWSQSARLGSGNLSGIVADSSGIIVASGDLGMVPPETEAFAGLIAIENGDRPVKIVAPEGVQLSDIAFYDDDVVYASDPLGGGVYAAHSSGEEMEVLVAPGTLRSPQGIAPSEDGSRLYISDYRYGLAIVDTATGEVSRLVADEPMLLDGIDGLWLYDGELIAVQNGMNPMRIIALRLSQDGNRITSMRVLEQANPEWTEPLGGDIHEGALYYIGNGSWDLFEEGGTLREGAELRATQVRRLRLAENPPD